MNVLPWVVLRCHALLVRLYPPDFRREFEVEMRDAFAVAAAAARRRGRIALMALLWRELRDGPRRLLTEHWCSWRERRRSVPRSNPVPHGLIIAAVGSHGGWTMPSATQFSPWTVDDRRHAILASLPPLVFGLGLAAILLLVGPRPLSVPRWQIMLGVAPGALAAAGIVGGGLVAAVRRLPDWGYTWLGAAVMVVLLSAQVVAEELAESGITLPPAAEAMIGGGVVIGGLVTLGIAARRGWAQAGLVSIGMASMMGLAVCYSASSGPLHRHDVAILVAPLGLLSAALSYAYVRRSGSVRLGAVLGVWCLNAMGVWLASRVWQDWQAAHGQPSFFLPMLVFLTGALLIGPLLGWLGVVLRRLPGRS